MTNQEKLEKIKEKVAEYIYECNRGIWSGRKNFVYWLDAKRKVKEYFYKQADQILSLEGILIESDNQELPALPYQRENYLDEGQQGYLKGCQDGRRDMLKAGFRKTFKPSEVNP